MEGEGGGTQRSAPSVGGVGPGAQQQGDMELVGLVCDGENDLGTRGTRRELKA